MGPSGNSLACSSSHWRPAGAESSPPSQRFAINIARSAGISSQYTSMSGMPVEYQAELLFGRGQMLIRAVNLALLAGLKGVLLAWALASVTDTAELVLALNWVFAAIYVGSACLTYTALRMPAKAV